MADLDMNLIIIGSFLIILALSTVSVLADTGTYTINKEIAELTIHSNGDAEIEYTIDIQCDSGNIPWVTVGLPTAEYDIIEWGGSASSVRHEDKMGWSGVYVELSDTIYAGQHSEFTFKAVQHDFVYLYDGNATVQFTPSWWDRANTKFLSVIMQVSNDTNVTSVLTSSQPTVFKEGKIIWEWENIGRGFKKTVGVRMPVEAFTNLQPSVESDDYMAGIADSFNNLLSVSFLIGILICIFIFFMKIAAWGGRSEPYHSPSISLGSHIDDYEEKPVVRNLNMKCPRDGCQIERKDVKEVVINACAVCGGAWFDKGEIESLVKKDAKESEWFAASADAKSTETPWKHVSMCPRCNGTDIGANRKEGLVLYGCENCRGVWLDKGMFDKIKAKRLEQENEFDEKKKKDDDSFLLTWFLFYPWIMSTGHSSGYAINHLGGGSSGGAGSEGSIGGGSSDGGGCVSCACVASCACAACCAGGGAAGCAPKDSVGLKYIKIGGVHDVSS